MKLTTDQMEQIVADEMTGRTPRVTGDAADAFRKQLKADIALARTNGWAVEIPGEWQVE